MVLFTTPHEMRYLRTISHKIHPRRWLRRLWHSPRLFGELYTREDNTEVTVFTAEPERFTGYQPIRSLHDTLEHRRVLVSLVATARDESGTARQLLASLFQQTRLPDEMIIIDTGSQDGTLVILQELASKSPIPIIILSEPGANIAQGRNLAISRAEHPVIAVTDFGCVVEPTWLESLVAPFEAEADIQVVAGRYIAVDRNGDPARWLLGRDLSQIEPQNHLPSAVSIAFKKEAWQAVGGYPEWLSLTGEDTYFALELKRTTTHWAFVPEAFVRWEAPQTIQQYLKKSYTWSIGDGEAGTTTQAYRWAALKVGGLILGTGALGFVAVLAMLTQSMALLLVVIFLLLAAAVRQAGRIRQKKSSLSEELLLLGVYAAELLGFLKGLRQRPDATRRRLASVRGVYFILAGVPIDDTGGGARWTQIALELIRRQYLVVFLHKFPKYESVELNLAIRHPNLHTAQIAKFLWESFWSEYGTVLTGKPINALVELPLRDFHPLLKEIQAQGGTIIYDLLDDWDTSLGGQWYDPTVERAVIDQSQVLITTAVNLANRLRNLSDRPVSIIPNAVNHLLFNPDRVYELPQDFPAADWSMIYIGALWGEWFDWDLLVRLAQENPEAAVVVIGDYVGQCPDPPRNLHFLGLKPQQTLPAYLAHAQVAIVPWKVNLITQATSPLKVYEYLAMHRPVVAPTLAPLNNLPGVHLAENNEDFVLAARAARHAEFPIAEVRTFIQGNSWHARVTELLALTQTATTQEKSNLSPDGTR